MLGIWSHKRSKKQLSLSKSKEVSPVKTNLNRGGTNAGPKVIETNKTETIYMMRRRERQKQDFTSFVNRKKCGFFSIFFFQVANVHSAAYLADGCFTTQHL